MWVAVAAGWWEELVMATLHFPSLAEGARREKMVGVREVEGERRGRVRERERKRGGRERVEEKERINKEIKTCKHSMKMQ